MFRRPGENVYGSFAHIFLSGSKSVSIHYSYRKNHVMAAVFRRCFDYKWLSITFIGDITHIENISWR